MSTDELDRVALAIRTAIASMDPAVLVSMASDEGPTDLTPFYVIAESVFTTLNGAVTELKRQLAGYRKHLDACEQIAGKALGYPWYKDDQKNFPGATEADGVCVGEHVGDTIVAELAERYEKTRDALENVVIAYGMGWDMDGVIEVAEDVLGLKKSST